MGQLSPWRRWWRAAAFCLTSPRQGFRALKDRCFASAWTAGATPTLLSGRDLSSKRKLAHVAAFSRGNVGDLLLTIALRDLFDDAGGSSAWQLRHAHPLFVKTDVARINACAGLVIGGGGLFLRDTNANANSGWQWNCPVERLREIKVPIVVFAVGYNRFRGQPDFEPVFQDHLALLAEKAVYLGLRNTGSMNAIRGYLPDHLRDKVRYQPCMTTLLAKLYPHLLESRRQQDKPVVAVNAAFDRPELRFGQQEAQILANIAHAFASLPKEAELHLVLHSLDDAQFAPYLRQHGVPFQTVNLRAMSPFEIVDYYAHVDLVIGMRGHAQLIPFGCGTPIISLVSHDKMRWFLEDIGCPEWGVEVADKDAAEQLAAKIGQAVENKQAIKARIATIQDRLWQTSATNVREAVSALAV